MHTQDLRSLPTSVLSNYAAHSCYTANIEVSTSTGGTYRVDILHVCCVGLPVVDSFLPFPGILFLKEKNQHSPTQGRHTHQPTTPRQEYSGGCVGVVTIAAHAYHSTRRVRKRTAAISCAGGEVQILGTALAIVVQLLHTARLLLMIACCTKPIAYPVSLALCRKPGTTE